MQRIRCAGSFLVRHIINAKKILPRVAGGKYDLHHPVLANWKGFVIKSRNIKNIQLAVNKILSSYIELIASINKKYVRAIRATLDKCPFDF